MNKIPVILDCDGQLDSFWGLAAAMKNEALDILAVTVNAGKCTADQSFANVQGYMGQLHLSAPLYQGSERTILNKEKPEWQRFGKDGKCQIDFPLSHPFQKGYAWDAIADLARLNPHEITVICFGPITNVAIALFKHEDLKENLKKVIVVGGSYDFGNATPMAEINMLTDPEASRALFRSGIDMEIVGYNAMRQTHLPMEELLQLGKGSLWQKTCTAMSQFKSKETYLGPVLAIFAIEEGHVSKTEFHVEMETKSELCRGRTTPYAMYHPRAEKNSELVMEVKVNLYKEYLRTIITQTE